MWSSWIVSKAITESTSKSNSDKVQRKNRSTISNNNSNSSPTQEQSDLEGTTTFNGVNTTRSINIRSSSVDSIQRSITRDNNSNNNNSNNSGTSLTRSASF